MKAKTKPGSPPDAAVVVAELKRIAKKSVRDGMARYAIPSDKAFGVSVGTLRDMAKKLGRSHELALGLWADGAYEPRMLATMVDEPDRVTPAQMEAWCREFDNWAICDTACFHLFDRTPHAFAKVAAWSARQPEYEKRAAFALLASLAGHDRTSADEPFERCLSLIEKAASDERNFVKKGVSWALRGIGHRSAALHAACVALAKRLAETGTPAARWVGRDALRDLTRPAVTRKVAKRGKGR